MGLNNVLFKLFFICVGLAVGGVIVTMIHLYSGIIGTHCPSFNNRVCNDAGYCNEYGICECDAQYSGEACEHTGCGGYDEASGSVCYGHGVCLPPNSDYVPDYCKEEIPSASNGYVRSGLGWADARCKAYVDGIWAKMERGTASEAEMASVPTCACHSPYGSRSCLYMMCPMSSDFEICSGNGNVSVGYNDNMTVAGNGCQCSEYVSLNVMVQVLPREYLDWIRMKYLHHFIQGFCGTPRIVLNTLVFVQSENAVKCYCDEMHYGVSCMYGVCPDVEGVFCDGHGHPGFGFGVEVAIDHKPLARESECDPNCAPGMELCYGRCDDPKACGAKEPVCPIERPYRCPSLVCVSGAERLCDSQFISGYWDDLNNLRHSLVCNLNRINMEMTLTRQHRREVECFGEDSMREGVYYVTQGDTNFGGSRVISMFMDVVGSGELTFAYRGNMYVVHAPGYVHVEMRRSLYYAETSVGNVITTKMTSLGYVLLSPYVALESGQSVQLKKADNSSMVVKLVQLDVRVDENGDRAYVVLSETNVLDTGGVSRSVSYCAASPFVCLWQRYDAMQYVTMFNLTMKPVSLGWVAEVDAKVWPQWECDGVEWSVHLASPHYASRTMTYYSSPSARVRSIEYVLERDVIVPCICQPVGKSKSEYDVMFMSQRSRPNVQEVGEFGVGVVVDHEGRSVLVRGEVIGVQPLRIRDSVTRREMGMFTGEAKSMTVRENGLGYQTCDDVEYPVRCGDGSCSTMEHRLVTGVHEECDCLLSYEAGLVCDCVDTFGTVTRCEGDSSCYDTHGGVMVDLYDVCFWSPRHEPEWNRGFNRLFGNTYFSSDSHTMPVMFVLPSCNDTLEFEEGVGLTLSERCGVDDRLYVRMVHAMNVRRDNWTVIATHPFNVTMYTHYGGASVFTWTDAMVETSASVNVEMAHFVRDTSFGYWESSVFEGPAYVKHVFLDEPKRVVSVYVDFVKVGLATRFENMTFPVSILIQAEEEAGSNEWFTIGKVKEDVLNGSAIHTIPIDHVTRVSSVRLFSYFTFAVRSFIPFVEQNCSSGWLIGESPPDIVSKLVQFRETPPSLFDDCVCDDSCVLDGANVGKDGVCSDYAHNNVTSGACVNGTDCTDCGTNMWAVDGSLMCLNNENVKRLYLNWQPYLSQLAGLDGVWTVEEYVYLGRVNLSFKHAWDNQTVWRWTKPLCEHECLLYRCEDGSCANDPSNCPQITYKCRGNGCVRADINLREYSCACDKGYGGVDCALSECMPGDPETGLIDPHKWCTCNGPSPLKIRPPFELVWGGARRTFFTDEQVLKLNRPDGYRKNAMDVSWINVYPDKAPYGIAFLRVNTRGNASIYTNCPYRVRTRTGVYFELDECVMERETMWPYEVKSWKPECPEWLYETQYDDAPYRCPSGHCVAHERDCYTMNLIDPKCGSGSGRCMVDGTCVCEYGKETFIITERLTGLLSIPYKHTADGVTNPIVWGVPNDNRFVNEWCRARNCSEVDCSPPTGCYPGSVELDFADKQFECQDYFPGKCVVDVHDCKSGEVTEPLLCSGNGELRKRDYRDEWYCECGSYVHGVFTPNGFGGTSCQDYFCQDDPKRIYYAHEKPHTKEPFVDANGNVLPGKWLGPCGGLVGANPDDAAEWAQCCPGLVQLEMCDRVLCLIGGVTQCVAVDECMGYGRTPKVYPCNGKGTVLADGSCDCVKDKTSGVGYVFDLAVYSTGKGCFKKVVCPTSAITGTVCNAQPACAKFDMWSDLNIPYITQQAIMFAAREGLPMTNQSVCERLVNPNELSNLVLQALYNKALYILSEVRAVETDICVYPNDNSSAPYGMVPYVGREAYVGSYMQSLGVPYVLTNVTSAYPFLFDSKFVHSKSLYAYSRTSQRYLMAGMGTIVYLTLEKMHHLDIVRLHVQTDVDMIIRFQGQSVSVVVCQDVNVRGNQNFQWVDVFCMPTYRSFKFAIEMPDEWSVYCKDDATSVFCEEWMRSTCVTISGGVVQLPGSLQYFNGCSQDSRCCVLVTSKMSMTSVVQIMSSSAFMLDEIVLFGHENSSLPLPIGLANFIFNATNSTCVDEKVFIDRSLGLGGQGAPFRANGASTHDFVSAHGACDNDGGVFASAYSEVNAVSGYASEFGDVCFTNNPDDVGCLVNARDRNEVDHPSNLSHIFQESCTTWGCYELLNVGGVGYYSDAGNGSQWQYKWNNANLMMGWSDYFAYLRSIRAYQQSLTGPVTTYYRSGGTFPPSNYFTVDFAATTPTSPSPAETTEDPGDSGYVDIWNYEFTCTVTFYSTPNCGYWRGWNKRCRGSPGGDCTISGYTASDLYKGAFKRYVITPKNYMSFIGVNLVTHRFDTVSEGDCNNLASAHGQCSDMSQGPYYSGVLHSHVNQDLRYIASWSIDGPCNVQIKLEGGALIAYNERTDVGSIVNTVNTRAGFSCGITHSLACGGALPSNGNMDGDDPFSYYFAKGCYPQIFEKSKADMDFLRSGSLTNGQANTNAGVNTPGDPGNYGSSYYGDPLLLQWDYGLAPKVEQIFIGAAFSTGLIRTYSPTERLTTYTSAGTDTFVLGWQSHPYMCAMFRAVRIAETYMDNLGIGGMHNLIASPGAPVGDFSVPVVPFVSAARPYAPQAGCRSLYGSLCTWSVVFDFRKCNGGSGGSELPRKIIPCSQCYKQQMTAKYQWNQQFVNGAVFLKDMNGVGQTSYTGSFAVVTPTLLVDWNGTTTVNIRANYSALPRYSKQFVRLSASLKPGDYGVKFEFDSCVQVTRAPTASQTQGFMYMFTPTACNVKRYRVMCITDSLKYAVKLGTQCPPCGPASRNVVVMPGVTVFMLHRDADPSFNVEGHLILNAYNEGKLESLVRSTSVVPWDDVRASISDSNFIFAFVETRDYLRQGISMRPGYTSRGATEDAMMWVDMDLHRMFPFDCGVVRDVDTGEKNRVCAASKSQCIRPVSDPVWMNVVDMPKVLTGMYLSDDLTVESECGVYVDPATFNTYDDFGGPQPRSNAFQVLSSGDDGVTLKVMRVNGTWTNTGKSLRVNLGRGFNIYGKIKSSVTKGMYRLWISQLSPSYSYHVVKTYIMPSYVPLKIGDNVVHVKDVPEFIQDDPVFGYDFVDLQTGSQLLLTKMLATTNDTMAACIRTNFPRFVEPPNKIVSGSLWNECKFTISNDEVNHGVSVDVVGTCVCDKDGPYDGPGCEWPATVSERGKMVCNGYGDDGGMEFASSLAVVRLTSSLGVYLDNSGYSCKCVNPGLMIRTIMRPASAFDYAFVLRNDRLPNAPLFIRVTDLPSSITWPVSSEKVEEVCNVESAVLPSWMTGSEIDEMFLMNIKLPLFTDLSYENGLFGWKQRNEQITVTVVEGDVLNGGPCATIDDVCLALNWNNVVFNMTKLTNPGLTDGKNATVEYVYREEGYSIPYARSVNYTMVYVWSGVSVETNNEISVKVVPSMLSCDVFEKGELRLIYECVHDGVVSWGIVLNNVQYESMYLREVVVYSYEDKGRVPGWFD